MLVRRYEMPWRRAYEAYAAISWGLALLYFVGTGVTGTLPRQLALPLTLACFAMSVWRVAQALRILILRAALCGRAIEVIGTDDLARSCPDPASVFLGFGFEWQPVHSQRLYELSKIDYREFAVSPRWLQLLGYDPTLSVNDVTVSEADGTASFTVTLSAVSAQTITVAYNTTDGTATAGADYTSATGTLTFAPGTTAQTISVPITNDTVFEGATGETFSVNLASPTNATIADPLGAGTITDNDSAPTITSVDDPLDGGINSVTVAEGTSAVFTVALSNASSTDTIYPLVLSAGSALLTSDYTNALTFSAGVSLSGGNVTVPAGVTSFTVTVPTVNDAINEPSPETFTRPSRSFTTASAS